MRRGLAMADSLSESLLGVLLWTLLSWPSGSSDVASFAFETGNATNKPHSNVTHDLEAFMGSARMAEVSIPNNGSRTRARDTSESFTDSFSEVLKTASPKTFMLDTTDLTEEVASSPRLHTRSVSYNAAESPAIGVRVQRSKPRHRLNPERRDRSRRRRRRPPSDEERLMRILFNGYNPAARPVLDSTSSVEVRMQFSLMHIKDLDVRSQILTTTGLLILDWTDERLIWNKSDHNNMEDIIVVAKSLWLPEFAVINGAEKLREDYSHFRVVVSHDGQIHWEPGGVFKTMCAIDIKNYPFDEQNCHLLFGAWSYQTTKMNMSNTNDSINRDSYTQNGEWQIITTQVGRGEFFYTANDNERFAFVDFGIYLRRRHTFYVVNVIVPSIMTSVLLLSVFFCTPAQKVQIGVVVLLSFRIFLLNVAGNIPKTSDHVPLLVIYLTCTMGITTLSMVLTVLVLNLHFTSDFPVPAWLNTVVLQYTARALCMCQTAPSDGSRPNRYLTTENRPIKRLPLSKSDGDEEEMVELTIRRRLLGEHREHVDQKKDDRLCGPEQEPDYSKDWKKLADVVDRLFFWLFLFAIIVTTLILFQPLTAQ